MKKNLFIILLLMLIFAPTFASAQTLADRLSGWILLQVQAHGEAWYVYPINAQRFYLGRPLDAFRIMSNLSLGISNKDFDAFNGVAPSRLAGYILLKVEDLGKAYYVNPVDLKMHFLGRPDDAFNIMRNFGLGITTFNLSLIPISGSSAIPPGEVMNIIMEKPAQNQEIGLPVEVSGQARVFEGTVNVRLKNSNGKILVERFTTAQAPDIGEYGPFNIMLSYPSPGTRYGSLEVFALSPKDGSEIDKVITAISFANVESQIVKAYFSNSKLNPNQIDCGKVFPVDRRIEATVAVGRRSLEEMLMGPTIGEAEGGYFTNINDGVLINSLTISGGVATVDFNDILNQNVAGSCRVEAIRAQITETLKQFPTVDSAVISVNGETEGILEP